jgi:hypothetical protein
VQLGPRDRIRRLLLDAQPTVHDVGEVEGQMFEFVHHPTKPLREFEGMVVDGCGRGVQVPRLLAHILDLRLEPTCPVERGLGLVLDSSQLLTEDFLLGVLVRVEPFHFLPEFGESDATGILDRTSM